MKNNKIKLVADRGKTYGKFVYGAKLAQTLKDAIEGHSNDCGVILHPDQREALQMICTKISRIANGDPHHSDSWADIAGYATLIVERLKGNEL